MKPRVLIVDDDELILDGLTSLLEMEDIDSAGACDRLSAAAMMSGTFYPVIVADVRLHTEEQGLLLLDDIRRVSPRSRVITMTGFSTPELDRKVRELGSTKVIRKQESTVEIIEAITALIAQIERLAAAALTSAFDARLLTLRNRYIGSLPARVAAIAQTLRERQQGILHPEGTLDRQFHNLAGTAGTYGLFAIAAAASDGVDECTDRAGVPINGYEMYLWSLVEELENAVADGTGFESTNDTVFQTMNAGRRTGLTPQDLRLEKEIRSASGMKP